MNNEATITKMQKMKLYGMLRAFNQSLDAGMMNKFTTDELPGHLIDAKWDERHNRRLEMLIKAAKFHYRTSLDEMDFKLDRGLDKNILQSFSNPRGTKEKRYYY